MGQPNDRQLLKQLTSDSMATRNPAWGWRLNHQRSIHLSRMPIIKELYDEGVFDETRELKSVRCSARYIRHKNPIDAPNGVPCPVCKSLIKCPPELSMAEHKKTCRLLNYFSASGAKVAFYNKRTAK